jgi:regulator of protease activity HflC (stomatin/prohibitin superfamily)
MVGAYLWTLGLVVLFILIFFRLIRIVPEQEAWVVEQLGRYRKTLGPGLHMVVPLVQRVAYRHNLKEEVIDVPPQICITKDNVQVTVDGLLYLKVVDPVKASYGIENYRFGTTQLAQTTMRSEIGRIDLDHSFSERDTINNSIVKSVDEASDPWGIKVTRYEIRDISPPEPILQAMEQQMRAEREKRSEILRSEGEKQARINLSKGEREEAINLSRGERQKRINEAEGRARAISLTAESTAQGIREVAQAARLPKGQAAMSLRIAEHYIGQLGRILEQAGAEVLPLEVAQLRALLQAVTAAPAATAAGGRRTGPGSAAVQPAAGGEADGRGEPAAAEPKGAIE